MARGRPQGSLDKVKRPLRAPLCGDGIVCRCKLQLLQLLLHTHDLVASAANNSGSHELVRFLFAHTEAFEAWVDTRRVDSLGLQLRTWLRRDLLPLVEGTRFFSCPLPDTLFAGPKQRPAALSLLGQVVGWVRRGAPLDCLRTRLPLPEAWLLRLGSERWLAARREQRLRDEEFPRELLAALEEWPAVAMP